MGAIGSGRRLRPEARSKCEAVLRLDIRDLRRRGLLQPGQLGSVRARLGRSWSGTDIFVAAQVSSVKLSYPSQGLNGPEPQPIIEHIAIDTRPQHFGGERKWFVCPECERFCGVLYGRKFFGCRLCQNLAYRSQSLSRGDRALSMAQKVRTRLGGSANMLQPFPDKPPHMHWRTYERLHTKGVALERAALGAISEFADKLHRKVTPRTTGTSAKTSSGSVDSR